MSLGRMALDRHAAVATVLPRGGIAGECTNLFLFFGCASSACFTIADFFPFSCPCSGVVQTVALGRRRRDIDCYAGYHPLPSPPSLTLFGAEIGLSLFCSYREIHSLVLVGLPVAGIAPTP